LLLIDLLCNCSGLLSGGTAVCKCVFTSWYYNI